jgi:hypothetical protein
MRWHKKFCGGTRSADLACFGGDDMSPDPDHEPTVIAGECADHFKGTFGVMQPTGDRWSNSQGEAYADKVAGSAWVGREFCERTYGGEGPFWHEYWHMCADNELLEVASKLGVFWQRPDLEHYHDHWQSEAGTRRCRRSFGARPARRSIGHSTRIYSEEERLAASLAIFRSRTEILRRVFCICSFVGRPAAVSRLVVSVACRFFRYAALLVEVAMSATKLERLFSHLSHTVIPLAP